MPKPTLDLAGQRFGRLIAKEKAGSGRQGAIWTCLCDCGTTKNILAGNLRCGSTSSCGCLSRELWRENRRVRGMGAPRHGDSREYARSPEHRAWTAMKQRCSNPNNKKWRDYGGRGIEVSPQWINSYEAFLQAMGRRPSPKHSIDRIDKWEL